MVEMKLILFLCGVLVAVAVTMFIAACTPSKFILGAETPPPAGCVEARTRGHDC